MSWKKQLESSNRPRWAELARQMRSELSDAVLELNQPTARLATLKAGGAVALGVTVHSVAQLQALLEFVRTYDLPWMVFGGMSNTLVRDKGYDGIGVFLEGGEFAQFDLVEGESTDILRVGAAQPTARILKAGRERGWAAAAPLSGIPGYVGGAIAMNAGSRDIWISHFLRSVRMVTLEGKDVTRPVESVAPGYRSTQIRHAVVVSGEFAFEREDIERTDQLYRQQLEYRNRTQPVGTKNCGSVFRNPEGDSAGRLIEAVNLKGVRVHGARISSVHANFIENVGGASAADIESLVQLAQKKVKDEAGIELQRELRIVGTR